MLKAVAAVALVAGLVAPNLAEAARAICKPRAEIVKILNGKFKETRRSFGLQNDRRVLEVFASATGSWTAILSLPSGEACVVASGEAWTELPPEPAGDPA